MALRKISDLRRLCVRIMSLCGSKRNFCFFHFLISKIELNVYLDIADLRPIHTGSKFVILSNYLPIFSN